MCTETACSRTGSTTAGRRLPCRRARIEWLSEDGKRARLLALLGALEAIEADLQIVGSAARWDLERYAREQEGYVRDQQGDARGMCATSGGCAGDVRDQQEADAQTFTSHERKSTSHAHTSTSHAHANDAYVGEHHRRLRDIGTARPAVFLLVSLRDPERDVASYVSQAAEQQSARVAEAAQARDLATRQARADRRRAGARAGARRPGARAAGGLPAGPPGARGGAAVADPPGVLPGPGRAVDRWSARAAGARVRAQRRGAAGAAGGRRDALDGRLRRAPRAGGCGSSPSWARAGRRSWLLGALPERRSFPGRARRS